MRWANLLSEQKISDSNSDDSEITSGFANDYKQIIMSQQLRSMHEKTQIFPLGCNDLIRTRYTHSAEVSAISKLIAQRMVVQVIKSRKNTAFNEIIMYQISELLMCAAMLHDIGQPAFGHFGEEAIKMWYRTNLDKVMYRGTPVTEVLSKEMTGDLYNFSSLAQSLRCVIKLDNDHFSLSSSVLSVLIRYAASSTQIRAENGIKKTGYFYSERSQVAKIQEAAGTANCRHPLTYVLDAAERIASMTAVMEDSVKKGRITCLDLLSELRKEEYLGDAVTPEEYKRFAYIVKNLGICYENARKDSYQDAEVRAIRMWISSLQNQLAEFAAVCFADNYDKIMKGTYTGDIVSDSWCRIILRAFNDVEKRFAFFAPCILNIEISAKTIFGFLLNCFINAAVNYDTDNKQDDMYEKYLSIIPDRFKNIYHRYAKDEDDAQKLYLRFMMVTDFICEMTDNEAKNLYKTLNGII
ncbi:MAG: dNTP triphosphohydrolase [Oscillospiraceae bacterium]|nr:dNTP triphosphohydrolase [Oscillospiraceae bacterium]